MLVRLILALILFILSLTINAQDRLVNYEVSPELPYGQLNPNAPEQLNDYEFLIGECDCKSESRNPDNTWAKPVDMIWRWKYIMNGMAVQDETLKNDGKHSGSIRQYSKDSARWYVHYYSSAAIVSKLSAWEGNKKGDNIVLYKEQKAPNGIDGFSRLTFYDIDKKGYKWIGEWVDKTEKIIFPFWKITCTKRKEL